jgi:hypothetical protein
MTVYFIECAGRIKIGYAKDVGERIKALSTGSAHDLNLLVSLDGSVHFERAIHAALKPHRVRGEWFNDCEPVRSLMADLQQRGGEAVSFVEPPPRETRGHDSGQSVFESPLRPVMVRIDACMDRYVGKQVSAALKMEIELGLEKGALANQRIGGHYTSRRAEAAFALIQDTMSAVENLTSAIFKSVFDPDMEPIGQETIVLPAVRCVERLERGLSVLFASPDLETTDMSGYAKAA